MLRVLGLTLVIAGAFTALALLLASAWGYTTTTHVSYWPYFLDVENCTVQVLGPIQVPETEGFSYNISLIHPYITAYVQVPNATCVYTSGNTTVFLLDERDYPQVMAVLSASGVRLADTLSVLSRKALAKVPVSTPRALVNTTPVIVFTPPVSQVRLPVKPGVYRVVTVKCVASNCTQIPLPRLVEFGLMLVAKLEPTPIQYLRSAIITLIGATLYAYDASRHRYGYSPSRLKVALEALRRLKVRITEAVTRAPTSS
ncbi:hypothetical protein [Infirmifilum sp. SLHALR2]|nr:MAG: hypothetical protein B7L53_06625 [Thermofilum sp. NZ13]